MQIRLARGGPGNPIPLSASKGLNPNRLASNRPVRPPAVVSPPSSHLVDACRCLVLPPLSFPPMVDGHWDPFSGHGGRLVGWTAHIFGGLRPQGSSQPARDGRSAPTNPTQGA